MYTLSLAVLLVAVAVATAGLVPLDTAAVVSGPSGVITRAGLGYGPVAAPLAYGAPLAARFAAPIAAPLAYAAAPIPHAAAQAALSLSVPAGSGLEGQWIPDINEKLYDDGSYKPYIYGL